MATLCFKQELFDFSMNDNLPSPKMPGSPPKVYSLLALSQSIRNLIHEKVGQQVFWLKAEIAQLKQAASGHYYLELVQERDGRRLASMQAVIWFLDFQQIHSKHGAELLKVLKQGQELVLKVSVDFHSVFGLKLLVKDLDMDFVLGELEKRKRLTLEKLRGDGLLDVQKKLKEPMVWQRIAVLSSEEAAAYQDFKEHLKQNEFGYRLQTVLFPVPVQGHAAADLIGSLLGKIPKEEFDLIVIIRGGGSRLDLDTFNDEGLARAIAAAQLPVHTGIGHESDLSVADMVAHKAHKTPTAVADYLLDRMLAFENSLQQIAALLHRRSKENLKFEDQNLLRFQEVLALKPLVTVQRKRGDLHQNASTLVRLSADAMHEAERFLNFFKQSLANLSPALIRMQKDRLEDLERTLNQQGQFRMEQAQRDLNALQERLELLKPQRTLERGYSITRKNQKGVLSIHDVKDGDRIETQVKDGSITSTIIKKEIYESGSEA